MILENIISNVGLGTKRLTERYSEYPGPVHDQHVYYAYEPSSPGHGYVAHTGIKHNFGSGLKANASMSALTLLAFLFFLHILQQCIKEHMNDMGASPIMVMTAGKEGEGNIAKSANKIDKSGVPKNVENHKTNANVNSNTANEKYGSKNPFQDDASSNKKHLTKIQLTEKVPADRNNPREKYQYFHNYENENQSPAHPGFISNINEDNF